MSYAFAAVKRHHRAIDTRDLPLAYVEVLVKGFGREVGARPVLLASF
jgi:hypothetical protein